jgi:hypothetical protein
MGTRRAPLCRLGQTPVEHGDEVTDDQLKLMRDRSIFFDLSVSNSLSGGDWERIRDRHDLLEIDVFDGGESVRAKNRCNASRFETADRTFIKFPKPLYRSRHRSHDARNQSFGRRVRSYSAV